MINMETLQDFLDKVLYYAMDPAFQDKVRQAGEQFRAHLDDQSVYNSEFGFNQWLIHDYRFADGGGFVQAYLKNTEDTEAVQTAEMALKSRLSVFQVLRTQHNVLLKDLLTRKDYALDNEDLLEALDETALHLLRIYPAGDKWLALQEREGIDAAFKEPVSRGMLEKYTEAVRINGPQDIEAFIYGNPILVYKFIEIITGLELAEDETEEAYTVHQGRYVMQDLKETAALLAAVPGVELAISEADVWIFRLSAPEEPEAQLAEIVLSEHTMDVECLSRQELAQSRKILESHLGGQIAHVRDEIIDIDTLLEE